MEIGDFDWDDPKEIENRIKHGVTFEEACQAVEDALENDSIEGPNRHKGGESRYRAIGKTDLGRNLLVVFTIRGKTARIISARNR